MVRCRPPQGQLVDRRIDFGQLETFDAKGFFKNEQHGAAATSALTEDIQKALAQPKVSGQIIDLLTALTESGYNFDKRYRFGVSAGAAAKVDCR